MFATDPICKATENPSSGMAVVLSLKFLSQVACVKDPQRMDTGSTRLDPRGRECEARPKLVMGGLILGKSSTRFSQNSAFKSRTD